MPKIILTIGASCSGKTSWAEDFILNRVAKTRPLSFRWINLNRDDFRFAMSNSGVRDWSKYKFSKANEKKVSDAIEFQARNAAKDGINIIISDTNLNYKTRAKWIEWAREYRYEYEEKLFHCSWDILTKRNAQRSGGISESMLWNQYMRFEREFGDIKLYSSNKLLPTCIICDIDGTVADMRDRSPFEWGKVMQDSLRTEIAAAVGGLATEASKVIFLSGRDGSCYELTYQWLMEYFEEFNFSWELHMREAGDNRKDSVIKDELFEEHIRHKYNVLAVVDDRPQMIRHWTLKGMPNIINVGEYNREF